MAYGKMNALIDIISTAPVKDADGFVTPRRYRSRFGEGIQRGPARERTLGEYGGVLRSDRDVPVSQDSQFECGHHTMHHL
jgi:hypothetical protein